MNFNLSFDQQTESQWLELWLRESGGKSIDEFIKEVDNHFAIRPYYSHESAKVISSDIVRTYSEPVVADWIDFGNLAAEKINSEILKSLTSGATGLYVNVYHQLNWETALREVGMEYITSVFDFRGDFSAGYRNLEAFLSLTRLENSADKVKVVLPWTTNAELFREILLDLNEIHSGFLIDLAEPLEAGVPPGQALAIGMGMLQEIYSVKPTLLKKIGYLTCCNGLVYQDFVLNRALRLLHLSWMAKTGAEVESVYIHTRTGRSDLISIDHHTNLIKNSIKVISAIVSGADGITVLPYKTGDAHNADALRLARNQALIAIHESKLNRYRDPLAGSYAFETMTDGLIDAALDHLEKINKYPTVFDFIGSLDLTNSVNSYRKKLTDEFIKGNRILIGVTKFQPKDETLKSIKIDSKEGSPFTPFVIQNEFL